MAYRTTQGLQRMPYGTAEARPVRPADPMTPSKPYRAFISYSWGARPHLVSLLHQRLQGVARPRLRFRARRVFLDRASLPLITRLAMRLMPLSESAIREMLERAVRGAEWFILIASPEAAKSKWVEYEVSAWLRLGQTDRLLIVLVDGQIVWSTGAMDFDRVQTTSLPRCLGGVLSSEPLYLDLRNELPQGAERSSEGQLRRAAVILAAAIEDRPVDELEMRDRRWT